jgi:hypothetical protein
MTTGTLDNQDLRHLQVGLRNNRIGRKVFDMLSDIEDSGVVAGAPLAMPNQPVTTNTIDVGADVYEFVTSAGNVADDANIAVEIKGSAALTRAELIAAINATNEANEHANINNVADDAAALANGTEKVVADEVGTDVRVRNADAPGGNPLAGDQDILLAEAITDAADIWKTGDVNMNTLGGRAQGARQRTLAEITVTAKMITNGHRIDAPFTPTRFSVQVTTAGVVIGTTSSDAYAIANDGLQVTFGGGAAPDMQVGDVLRVELVS